MCLTRSSLSIGKNCSIIAFKYTFNDWVPCVKINLFLGTFMWIYWIEWEGFGRLPGICFRIHDRNFSSLLIRVHYELALIFNFLTKKWSAAYRYFYTFCFPASHLFKFRLKSNFPGRTIRIYGKILGLKRFLFYNVIHAQNSPTFHSKSCTLIFLLWYASWFVNRF